MIRSWGYKSFISMKFEIFINLKIYSNEGIQFAKNSKHCHLFQVIHFIMPPIGGIIKFMTMTNQ